MTNEFVGIDFNFSQYIQDNVEEGLSGVKGANSVKIIGPDLSRLETVARDHHARNGKGAGITDLGVILGARATQPEHQDRSCQGGALWLERQRHQQCHSGGVGRNRRDDAVGSRPPIRVWCGWRRNTAATSTRYAISSRLPDPERRQRLYSVKRSCLISLDTGASYIFRERNQRFVPIKFSVRGRDLAGAVAEAQERIARNVKMPTGYRISWAGEFEWLQQAKQRLLIILPVTFLLIVVLLYGLFNSWRDSLLALLGLPFAVSGGLLALYMGGLDFSISAAIGFISLMGVSVMSGILIINGYYRVAVSGMTPIEAMFHAVGEQMRPILMMTLSACIGLLPAAISTGIGSQVQRPLATVIVGGMLIGPIMLLVIVPALQTFFLPEPRQPAPQP